jgi:hypothetical protein
MTRFIGIKVNNIGYIPFPKSASTSIKQYFYQVLNNKSFKYSDKKLKDVHAYFKPFVKLDSTKFNFGIIRDPIKRFISAYSNRVLYYEELPQKERPTLNQFIENFEKYYKVRPIRWHTRPITIVLANRFKLVENDYRSIKWFNFEDLSLVNEVLNNEFQVDCKFPCVQNGGPKFKPEIITNKNLKKLKEFYKKDYEFIEWVGLNKNGS